MRKALLIVAGWLAFVLGFIGMFLPILPTTPFMLLAAACFARSSPRFHQWLLSSRLFGNLIRDWQTHHAIERRTKFHAIWITILTFSVSIYLVPIMPLRVLLILVGTTLLFFLIRLPIYLGESAGFEKCDDAD